MPVPQNAQAIWTFLTGQGFTANATAGIEGNIEQESGGSPTAGSNPPGAGLIQILGDAGGSLTSELSKTMAYIDANGSVADINANASSPSAAALYFSNKYERPNPADANNANREQSAIDTANAASSGNWPASSAAPATATTTSANCEFYDPASYANCINNQLGAILNPANWLGPVKSAIDTGATNVFKKFETDVENGIMRFGLILLGGLVIVIGIIILFHNEGSSSQGAQNALTQLLQSDKGGGMAGEAAESGGIASEAELAAVAM